jgi:hypothetical protein
MAKFQTRHGNADVPYRHFGSGISTIPSLPANEVIPLFIMMSVAAGDGPGVFADAQQRKGVQRCICPFLDMCRTAHKEDLRLQDLAELQVKQLAFSDQKALWHYKSRFCVCNPAFFQEHSRELLRHIKATFHSSDGTVFSKTDFKFPKFHMLLHFTDLIMEFGPLFVFDTDRWETFHQYTKAIYNRTSGVLAPPDIFAKSALCIFKCAFV